MECEKNMCPVIKLDGVLATGKQFDLDITLPEDNRSVIYGVVSDSCHNPVCDAVVKLVEVIMVVTTIKMTPNRVVNLP